MLDLSRLLPGAYCTQLLRGNGAEILVISPPDGDPLKGFPAAMALYPTLQEGKQGATLDLRSAKGREAFLGYVDQSDVLVEGFRPGTMERLGLGYDDLHARRPGLVYCAITGYGSRHPTHAVQAGHDLNYLARSGALSLIRGAQGGPVIPGLQIADLAGGLEAAFLIAAALLERSRTGEGGRVEVSMTDLIRSWTVLPRLAGRAGFSGLGLSGEFPCYAVYETADGWITVAALESKFWANLCRVLERDDLVSRQFDPSATAELASIFMHGSRADWAARFSDQDVCVEPVLTLEESEVG